MSEEIPWVPYQGLPLPGIGESTELEYGLYARERLGVDTMPDAVADRFDEWKRRLVDLSGRNRLIFHRETQSSLRFDDIPFQEFSAALLMGQPITRLEGLTEDALQPSDGSRPSPRMYSTGSSLGMQLGFTPDALRKRLLSLYRRARESLLEQGIHTLYVVLAFLEWYESPDSDQVIQSPLTFVPVELERLQGGAFALKPTGDAPESNVALIEKLKHDHALTLPEWTCPDEEAPDLFGYLAAVSEAMAGFARSSVVQRAVLDTFSFAKLVMYRDLEENRARALQNPLVRGVCGELPHASVVDVPSGGALDDRLSYSDCFHVLDADTSQREAIAAAGGGESFVLVGPPGTGKSQTIANIIADSIANRKRVLFVSEKAAALEVVYRRLCECKLGQFCLDLHSAVGNKREVLDQLQSSLDFGGSAGSQVYDYTRLEEQRRRLNAYARDLHKPFGTLRWTPFQVYAELTHRAQVPDVHIPLVGVPDVARIEPTLLMKMEEAIGELERLAGVLRKGKAHPWWGFRFSQVHETDRPRLRDALAELRRLCVEAERLCSKFDEGWAFTGAPTLAGLEQRAAVCESLQQIGEAHIVPAWLTCGQLDEHMQALAEGQAMSAQLLDARKELLSRYAESIFAVDAESMAERFATYARSFFRRHFASGPDKRALREQLMDPGARPSFAQLAEDVGHLRRHADAEAWFEQASVSYSQLFGPHYVGPETDWDSLSDLLGGVRRLNELAATSASLSQFNETVADVGCRSTDSLGALLQELSTNRTELRKLTEYFLIDCFGAVAPDAVVDMTFEEIASWVSRRLDQFETLDEWLRYKRLRRQAKNSGLQHWIEHFVLEPEHAAIATEIFAKSIRRQWLDEVYEHRKALEQFSPDAFEHLRRAFAAGDTRSIQEGPDRVIENVVAHRAGVGASCGIGQVAILKRESKKQRRHKPIRQLLLEIPELVQDLMPCMMMSPLTVSQYLGSERLAFDLVLFDEASQVKPEDALPAILRGSQLVLAGDPKQLPPTTFFEGALDGDAAGDEQLDALESILDETGIWLPERLLRWHYRSRDDALIAFSNREFYGNRLITFPSATNDEAIGVTFIHCQDAVYDRGGTATNTKEARVVADTVARLVLGHSADSIGVVAFSQRQQNAILDVFEERASGDPLFDALIAGTDTAEPFFVKNLETVQGDERDMIVISVGYGPDDKGHLTMNFGPLNREGGARRLNVAVTRARKRIVVVASMVAQDIASDASAGAQLLRRYLDFAARGREALETAQATSSAPESPFEEAVGAALEARGLRVEPQVGCGPYRVDFGIRDPDNPGHYLLGVECDGATYHSSQTARDRDRLREQVLEDRGWKLVRIWSSDWWRNPEAQIDRVLEAAEHARGRPALSGAGDIDTPDDEAGADDHSNSPQKSPIDHGERFEDLCVSQLTLSDTRPYLDDDQIDRELEASDARGYGFRPYSVTPRQALGGPSDFYDMAEAGEPSLLLRIREVVSEEAPVHVNLVVMRVMQAFGLRRRGARIQQLVDQCIRAVEGQGYCKRRGSFLWLRGEHVPSVRTNLGSHTARAADEISLEEIARAVEIVVMASRRAPKSEVIPEVSRALGFRRTIAGSIEQAISLACKENMITQDEDDLMPPEPPRHPGAPT